MEPNNTMLENKICPQVTIGGGEYSTRQLPSALQLQEKLGLITGLGFSGQLIHLNTTGGLYETRAIITPAGDYLLMFPDGLSHTTTKGYIYEASQLNAHYTRKFVKVNNLIAYRSKDKGKTWSGPTIPFDIDYNQHAFIPLIPRGSTRIYAFGTQPIWDMWDPGDSVGGENTPIGYRYSDDDGYHWSEVRLIRPRNDPGFRGFSAMRMTETDTGAWLLGTSDVDYSCRTIEGREYILRSEDQGQNWDLVPGRRNAGWYCHCSNGQNYLCEGRVIALGDGKAYMQARTPEGHLWELRSEDDGKTWSDPRSSGLVHPGAPPMLFLLADGKTLVSFIHNRCDSGWQSRSELWVVFSTDEGHTWSEPHFVLANAMASSEDDDYFNGQCSYIDMFVDGDMLNIFMPHRWHRALHLQISERELRQLPTKQELAL